MESSSEITHLPPHLYMHLSFMQIGLATATDRFQLLSMQPRLMMRDLLLNSTLPEPLQSSDNEILSRGMTYNTVGSHWDDLRQLPNLRWLHIPHSAYPALPTPVPLPHLRGVSIGTADERFEFSTAFLLASGVLISQPHIRVLALNILPPREDSDAAREDVTQGLANIFASALARNLRVIQIDLPGEPLLALLDLPAIKYGWLKVVLRSE